MGTAWPAGHGNDGPACHVVVSAKFNMLYELHQSIYRQLTEDTLGVFDRARLVAQLRTAMQLEARAILSGCHTLGRTLAVTRSPGAPISPVVAALTHLQALAHGAAHSDTAGRRGSSCGIPTVSRVWPITTF